MNTSNAGAAVHLKLREGLTIAVPSSLNSITTYVLLEQEEWFEKEIEFLRRYLKPGMTAIDIGANLGLYSLRMAHLVGPRGRVFSYEPGSEARGFLEQSRVLSKLDNLEIMGQALSDGKRDGHLAVAASSELRALDATGAGEPVRITSLDLERDAHAWSNIDFIKIDAEGEEERILAGGRELFEIQSPLVMFEIKAGNDINYKLRALFPAMGYRLFRQLVGEALLVPDDEKQPLDGYELNLFAAKPDRAAALAQAGLLAETIPDWAPTEDDRKNALAVWQRQKFAALVGQSGSNGQSTDADYQNALAGYATWRSLDRPVTTRCAALIYALQRLRTVCARKATAERVSTLARVAWEWGARAESVRAIQQLMEILRTMRTPLSEPFWPPNARFDTIAPKNSPIDWLAAAGAEQFEKTCSYSSLYSGASPYFSWICSQSIAGTEMERRRILMAARAGSRPKVPERLCVPAPDHLNAALWKAGAVEGTVV